MSADVTTQEAEEHESIEIFCFECFSVLEIEADEDPSEGMLTCPECGSTDVELYEDDETDEEE